MLPCQTFLDMCKLKNGFQFVCGKLGGPGMSLLWLKAKCQTYTCPSHPYLCSRSLWSMRQKTFSMLPIQPVMWSRKVWRVATVVCCISAGLQPFESCCHHLNRAVNYYKDLVNPNRFRFPYTKLEFVAAGPSAHLRLGEIQLGARPPPPKPRHLQVVFHRA